MIEIGRAMKFRVYNKAEKQYGKPIYLDDHRLDYEFIGGITNLEYALTNKQYIVELISGIKDMNDKNLTEGDIVECDIEGMGKTKCHVSFGDYGFNLVLDEPDSLPLQFNWVDAKNLNIVGQKNEIKEPEYIEIPE